MVESQGRQLLQGEPLRGAGIVAAHRMNPLSIHVAHACRRHRTSPWVSSLSAGHAHQLQGQAGKPRLLLQLTGGGMLYVGICHVEEAAWESPLTFVWVAATLDEQQAASLVGKDEDICRDGRAGVLVGV